MQPSTINNQIGAPITNPATSKLLSSSHEGWNEVHGPS